MTQKEGHRPRLILLIRGVFTASHSNWESKINSASVGIDWSTGGQQNGFTLSWTHRWGAALR